MIPTRSYWTKDLHLALGLAIYLFLTIDGEEGAYTGEVGGMGLILSYDRKLADWVRRQHEFANRNIASSCDHRTQEPHSGYPIVHRDEPVIDECEWPEDATKHRYELIKNLAVKKTGKSVGPTSPAPTVNSSTPDYINCELEDCSTASPIETADNSTEKEGITAPEGEEFDTLFLFAARHSEENSTEYTESEKDAAGVQDSPKKSKRTKHKESVMGDEEGEDVDEMDFPEASINNDEYYSDEIGSRAHVEELGKDKRSLTTPATEVQILQDKFVRTVINRKRKVKGL